jgi:hypothetical protein
VKSELPTIADSTPGSKNTSETAQPRTRKGKRRSAQGTSPGGAVRFFLSKSDSNGVPVLDREFGSESEAIVESLKTAKTYFVISEWKGSADLSKKIPLIRKEAVSHKKQNPD